MNPIARHGLVLTVVSFLLSSCIFIEPDKGNMGTCRTLKSDIIFNGATSNDRQSTIENNEAALQQHMYEENCT